MSFSEEDEAEAQPAAQTPCAGCRTLRRRCVPGCVFAPYFPAEGDDDDPSRFAAVHRVFGASNAARMLEDVAVPEDRRRAAETLVEEARARVRDPVFGCVSYVAILQLLNEKAREQVDAVRGEIAREFGDEAAAEAVDVAEADLAARVEARAQAERALAHARAKNAELLAARHAADVEWWRQERRAEKHVAGGWNTDEQVVKTENTASAGAAAAAAAGESSSEQTMVMPKAEDGTELDSPEGNGRPRQQMAETEEPAPAAVAASQRAMVTPPAAAADQRRHLAAAHDGTEPRIPGLGQLHQKVLELEDNKQSSTMASEKAPPAAPPHHDDSAATQLAGVGTSFLDGEQRAAAETLAKNLDSMIQRFTAAQQYQKDLAAARYVSMGADVTPRLQQLPLLQMTAQDMMTPLLAAGASRYGSLATQYDDDTELGVTLVHGHQDVHQQTVQLQQMTEAQRVAAAAAGEIAGEEGIAMQHAAAAELAGQLAAGAPRRHHPAALAQSDQSELDVTLELGQQTMPTQQLAAAAKVAGEQETIIHQVAAAELAREQEMTLLLQAAAASAQQDPVAEYSETDLGTSSLGQGHPYCQMLQDQLLSGTVGVAGEPNTTTLVQHVAAYADGEHGNGSSATAAFRSLGLGDAAPFLVELQPASQGQISGTLELQLDSSLPPPPLPLPSLGPPHSRVSQQQSTDGGGDEGPSSDLRAYLYY